MTTAKLSRRTASRPEPSVSHADIMPAFFSAKTSTVRHYISVVHTKPCAADYTYSGTWVTVRTKAAEICFFVHFSKVK